MGPGGLDPVEVFPTLPEEMQRAFETKDMDLLKKALTSMTPQKQRLAKAEYCIPTIILTRDRKIPITYRGEGIFL